jgi:putative FmdB family regulatory protein
MKAESNFPGTTEPVPLYEYRCKACGHQFEKIQSFSAPEEKECPVCHGELEKLISAPAIQFKGSGWYVSDYAHKGSSMKASADGDARSGDGASGDSKPAEKPAAAASDSGASPASASAPAAKSD